MRFILGFIFFALLFYALYAYFPDTFKTLVSWDAAVFNYIRDFFNNLFHHPSAPPAPQPTTPQALLFFFSKFG